eukprot:9419_1
MSEDPTFWANLHASEWCNHFRCTVCGKTGELTFVPKLAKPSEYYKTRLEADLCEWSTLCRSCGKRSVLGKSPPILAKATDFRAPSFDDALNRFVCCCGAYPMNKEGKFDMMELWKPVTDKQIEKASEYIRTQKKSVRAGQTHYSAHCRNHTTSNANTLGVSAPAHTSETRARVIQDLMDGWFTRRMLPYERLSKGQIETAKKLGLMLPWFDKDMARSLLRVFTKFPPFVQAHCTEELCIVMASLLSMWMPDEIPVVVEAIYECVLDVELQRYHSHLFLMKSWWTENVWSINLPKSKRPPAYFEYGAICSQVGLKEMLNIPEGTKKQISIFALKELNPYHFKNVIHSFCEHLRLLRSPESIPEIRRAVVSGMHANFPDMTKIQSYQYTLESLELPALESDPALKISRANCVEQSKIGETLKIREEQATRVVEIDRQIREDKAKMKKEIRKKGKTAYNAKIAARQAAITKRARHVDALIKNIKKFGFERATRDCARLFVSWFTHRSCFKCARVIQLERSKRCGACLTASYCSRKCQKDHWKEHKTTCQKEHSGPCQKECKTKKGRQKSCQKDKKGACHAMHMSG